MGELHEKDALVKAAAEAVKELAEEKGWDGVRSMSIRALRIEVSRRLWDKGVIPRGRFLRDEILKAAVKAASDRGVEGGGSARVSVDMRKYWPRGLVTPGSGDYPSYSFAEALYVGMYEEDPRHAHRFLYSALEKAVDMYGGRVRGLFLPLSQETWTEANNALALLLESAGEDRIVICRALARSLPLIAASVGWGDVVEVELDPRVAEMCPEIVEGG